MTMQSGQSLRVRLAEATRSFLELRPAVEAGRPWPLGRVEPGAPEDGWGPPEILAHVAEMLPYWLGEVERVLEGSVAGTPGTVSIATGAPTAFGRMETDPLRILRVEQDRSLPVGELFDRIAQDAARWDARLATFGEAQLRTIGRHPRRGDMTVDQMLEAFVVGHLEGHIVQLRDATAARPPVRPAPSA